MKKWSILLLLSFALILGCSALAIAASSPTAAPDDDPFFFEHNKALYPNWFVNGRTQPIFNNNTANYVKEDVFIEIPCDSDGDGKRDLVHAKITRISQTNSGFKSPVFMQVSPYRDGSPNVDPVRSHDVNIEQGINPDTTHYTYDTNIKTLIPRAADWPWTPEANAALNIPLPREATTVRNYGGNVGSAANDPGTGWYGYFVARGWAYAYLNCVGSLHAQGLSNCGGVEETLATISFAKWLNGEAKGFADPQCTIEYKPEWSNGKVSMGGTSYVGTLPIAAACSGYENITAVMPVEAISSWYDYYRDNGAVIAPGGYQGEDADELTDFIFSRRRTNLASYLPNNYPAEIAAIYWNHLAQITKDQDRATGDYNTFWDYRNYLATADRITAGVFIQQGTNDWNVKFKHFDQLWRAMDEKCPDTAKKAFIHLGTHTSVTSMYGSSHPGSSYMHALHLFLDH
ncbi:MAG: hypothetical protein FWF85_08895, partial [Clostridiales bacterium]|nr:hypothetical protein [Clostridiales bacterium]